VGFAAKQVYGPDSPGHKRRQQGTTLTKVKAMIRERTSSRREMVNLGLLGNKR
jgi:hypothetical protein